MQQQSVQQFPTVGAAKWQITSITLCQLTFAVFESQRSPALHAERKYEGLAQSDLSQFYPSLQSPTPYDALQYWFKWLKEIQSLLSKDDSAYTCYVCMYTYKSSQVCWRCAAEDL